MFVLLVFFVDFHPVTKVLVLEDGWGRGGAVWLRGAC